MTFIDAILPGSIIAVPFAIIFIIFLILNTKHADRKEESLKANYEKEEKKIYEEKEDFLKTFPDYEEWISLRKIFVPYSDLWRKNFPSSLEAEEAKKRFEELEHKFYKLGEEYDDTSSELYRKYLDEKTEINSRRVL